MGLVSTVEKHTPVLDESSFQQLLAAAFVVQQHNDGLRSRDPAQATSGVLTEIAEIQSLVRSGNLDLHAAAVLTAERLRKITRADGVCIELFSGPGFECLAECGSTITASVAARSLIAMERLKQGEPFQSNDTKNDIRLASSLTREPIIRTLIAAPIPSLGGFAGFIEVHWENPNACQEGDARACSLMAGLMSGILERSARVHGKEVRERERNEASAKLAHFPAEPSPNAHDFTRRDSSISDNTSEPDLEPSVHAAAEVRRPPQNVTANQPQIEAEIEDLPSQCRVCGRPFRSDEAFCGTCSMPRVAGVRSENLQGKWASLWYMQQARAGQTREQSSLMEQKTPEIQQTAKSLPNAPLFPPAPNEAPALTEATPPKSAARLWPLPDTQPEPNSATSHNNALEREPRKNISDPSQLPSTQIDHHSVASPADSQPEVLQHMWNAVWLRMRRRSLTWAVTAISLVLLLLVLAVWPSSKYPQLTWFQSVLVQLGLADVPTHPSAPVGNPAAQVWVDVHTGLYYCEGTDLFGKTPGGYLAIQREAQEDQFEPAARTTCP